MRVSVCASLLSCLLKRTKFLQRYVAICFVRKSTRLYNENRNLRPVSLVFRLFDNSYTGYTEGESRKTLEIRCFWARHHRSSVSLTPFTKKGRIRETMLSKTNLCGGAVIGPMSDWPKVPISGRPDVQLSDWPDFRATSRVEDHNHPQCGAGRTAHSVADSRFYS